MTITTCSATGDDPEAVVLNFMQPQLARWQLVSFGRQAGRDETGWQNVLIHSRLISERLSAGQALPAFGTPLRACLDWVYLGASPSFRFLVLIFLAPLRRGLFFLEPSPASA